ncbi:DUF397 domain-containing protein, partial [Streptomyces sodiiphilus]|uniref:DUF397 domain-containing protein n=1 Tax=Streptomyces sodiiphilus TaxID=226217 RepID=UPI0031E1D6F9
TSPHQPGWKRLSEGGACLEAALTAGAVRVRDTKNRGLSMKPVPADSWAHFLHHILRS